MLFPTIEFALFFAIVFGVSWAVNDRLAVRKVFLLIASYVFYAYWDVRFAFLLAECSLMNYMFGVGLTLPQSPRTKKLVLGAAVAGNLGILGFFKYYDFAANSLNNALLGLGVEAGLPLSEMLLPVGISFFTFQGISYVVDVYRGDTEARTSALDVLLYISFFPQLVAGPIVRSSVFMPQLSRPADPNRIPTADSFVLIMSGLFKKLIIAHYLAEGLVSPVFADPAAHSSLECLLGLYGFAVQLYCDFSAYSDIAIGVAGLLGFHFPENFNQPYRAKSLTEFWRRWHISLSSWLKDYLYRPLGGSKASTARTYRNIMIVMLAAGVWHGAAWTFVVFGIMHGLWMVLERWVSERLPNASWSPALAVAGCLLTFHVVCASLVFFHAANLSVAMTYWESLLQGTAGLEVVTPFLTLLIAGGLALNWLPKDWLDRIQNGVHVAPAYVQAVVLGLFFMLLGAFGPDGVAPFIYYQF